MTLIEKERGKGRGREEMRDSPMERDRKTNKRTERGGGWGGGRGGGDSIKRGHSSWLCCVADPGFMYVRREPSSQKIPDNICHTPVQKIVCYPYPSPAA